MGEPAYFQIDDVACRTGLTKRTIRYYEEIGLLHPPTRTEGGYRLFAEEDVGRLERIKRLRELMNFSLAEIKEHVEADELRRQLKIEVRNELDRRTRTQKLRTLGELTTAQISRIEDKMRQLEELRADYQARLDRVRAQLGDESMNEPSPGRDEGRPR